MSGGSGRKPNRPPYFSIRTSCGSTSAGSMRGPRVRSLCGLLILIICLAGVSPGLAQEATPVPGATPVVTEAEPDLGAVTLGERLCPVAGPAGEVEGETYVCGLLYVPENWSEPDGRQIQITYAVLGEMSMVEYLEAARLRTALREEMARLFLDIDLFALPTTVSVATKASDAEMESGFLDARALDSLCRFNFLGNLTGLPALSAPVGKDADGLPIGLQLVGDGWDEATVLAAAAHLERIEAARAERPQVFVNVL